MNTLFRKKRSGQITLLAILLGVLGLTVGLSVASRSLSDLKQASYVDFGTKALAAAESGAEWGLNQVSTGGSSCGSTAYDLISNNVLPGLKSSPLNIQTLNVTCQSGGNFLRKTVASDDVLQANMTAAGSGNGFYYVFWQNTTPAVEITALYSDYSIKRYAFNSGSFASPPSWVTAPDNFVNQSSGMSGGVVAANCPNTSDTSVFTYQSSGISSGTPYIIQIRARPLGGSSDIQVCGSSSLEPQSTIVTSTATTKNNVIKRIQVTKDNNGALPAIFDNVIFSGGDLTKQ